MGKVHFQDDSTDKKTEFNLVRVKSTWKRKLGKVNKEMGDHVSAAKMWVYYCFLLTVNLNDCKCREKVWYKWQIIQVLYEHRVCLAYFFALNLHICLDFLWKKLFSISELILVLELRFGKSSRGILQMITMSDTYHLQNFKNEVVLASSITITIISMYLR